MSCANLLKSKLSQPVGRLRSGPLHAPRRFVGACGLRHDAASPVQKSIPHSLQRINERISEPMEVEVLPARSHTVSCWLAGRATRPEGPGRCPCGTLSHVHPYTNLRMTAC